MKKALFFFILFFFVSAFPAFASGSCTASTIPSTVVGNTATNITLNYACSGIGETVGNNIYYYLPNNASISAFTTPSWASVCGTVSSNQGLECTIGTAGGTYNVNVTASID